METETTIIGAGVVGLAIAAEISKEFKDVFFAGKQIKVIDPLENQVDSEKEHQEELLE